MSDIYERLQAVADSEFAPFGTKEMARDAAARIAQLNERVGELEGLLTEAIPFIGWSSKPDGLVERCQKAVGYGEEQP